MFTPAKPNTVRWTLDDESYDLTPDDVGVLLNLYASHRQVRLWLELHEAEQAAGFPPRISPFARYALKPESGEEIRHFGDPASV